MSSSAGASPVIAWQAIGAACGGVGWAAVRLRSGTVWPVIALHALHDLSLQLGNLPVPLVDAVFDVALLGYGSALLRGWPDAAPLESHGSA